MTRSLLLAALMALSFNANAINMLSPFSPFSPFSIYNQGFKQHDEQRTYKCKVVNPTQTPCKAPCCVCYKAGKQIPCKK